MKSTTWTVTEHSGRVKRVVVAARSQRQLDRSRRNATNPPPPEPSLRRARPDR